MLHIDVAERHTGGRMIAVKCCCLDKVCGRIVKRPKGAQDLRDVDMAIGIAAVQCQRGLEKLAGCVEASKLKADHAHQVVRVRIAVINRQQFPGGAFGVLQVACAKMRQGLGEQAGGWRRAPRRIPGALLAGVLLPGALLL